VSKFKSSKAYTSLFYFNKDNITMFVLVYVDDIIVINLNQNASEGLHHKLSQEFALKDLGDLHYFLVIEIHNVAAGIILGEEK
jgi:hypothetical protein